MATTHMFSLWWFQKIQQIAKSFLDMHIWQFNLVVFFSNDVHLQNSVFLLNRDKWQLNLVLVIVERNQIFQQTVHIRFIVTVVSCFITILSYSSKSNTNEVSFKEYIKCMSLKFEPSRNAIHDTFLYLIDEREYMRLITMVMYEYAFTTYLIK